jgi:uncharacterized membrane protein
MINMRKANILALFVVLLQFLISIYYYPQMPNQMASHWNIEGIIMNIIPTIS